MGGQALTSSGGFQFSQASLQDYVDCPRRFQLRHLLRLDWPAPESEPALESERHLRQGMAFHRLLHQYMLGIAPERLSSAVAGEDLRRWWRNFLATPPPVLPAERHPGMTHYPEVTLSAPLGQHRLVAKYDLVAVRAGEQAGAFQGTIVDWKTSRKRPRRRWLAERLQTRVYPYLLVRAGSHLNAGRQFQPEHVEMAYWFADFPNQLECFSYDVHRYEEDEAYLVSLVEEIENLGKDEDFPLTARERRCTYCRYRSLCRRGVRGGSFDGIEDEPDLGDGLDFVLDFEQIAEIEY
jgi:CRISPR/Cas system-associated exonuclease Cas4 (RecB family)